MDRACNLCTVPRTIRNGSTSVLATPSTAKIAPVNGPYELPTTRRTAIDSSAAIVGNNPSTAPSAVVVHTQSPGQTFAPTKSCNHVSKDSTSPTTDTTPSAITPA